MRLCIHYRDKEFVSDFEAKDVLPRVGDGIILPGVEEPIEVETMRFNYASNSSRQEEVVLYSVHIWTKHAWTKEQ